MTLVLTAPNGDPGALVELLNTGQSPVRALLADSNQVAVRTSPVYVEDYLDFTLPAATRLRAAMIAAQAANTADGILFWMPVGTFSWTPGTFFQPRNNTQWWCYGCNIEIDMAGVASGQQFVFIRTETGVSTHADRIQIWGLRHRLLRVLTSFFGNAVQFEGASNCVIKDCEAETTFDAAATQ